MCMEAAWRRVACLMTENTLVDSKGEGFASSYHSQKGEEDQPDDRAWYSAVSQPKENTLCAILKLTLSLTFMAR